jgi:ribosome biogenesis GTPase A
MTIHWFPGHMTRAKRQMEAALSQVDMVIELRDARVVDASKNPMIEQLVKGKPRLIILSKKDLADPSLTAAWLEHLRRDQVRAIAMDFHHDNLKLIVNECQLVMEEKIQRQIRRGIKPRAIRAMVCGIPNVGKSTLINRLAKKKVANVADMPGVTKALQWFKVDQQLEILDTPGVLWPKFDDPQSALMLAITGAIADKVLDLEYVAQQAYQYLLQYYQDLLIRRYGPLPADFAMLVEQLGQQRGLLISNGIVNREKVYTMLLDEMRSDYFKGVTWERI